MKINIGPYTDWFGPYQLAELLCFWAKDEKDEYGFRKKPDWVHDFGEWLAYGSVEPDPKPGEIRSLGNDGRRETLLYKFLSWANSLQKRKVKVRIDRWDTWNMDSTLAHIILPMLKQLKETKHGSQIVDLEDVPEHLRYTSHEEYEGQKCLEFYHEYTSEDSSGVHARWDWVLDEMIFAFESYFNDWEDKFVSGNHDIQFLQLENGMSQMVHGPNHTVVYDDEGRAAYNERINNGLRLFGKYYKGLWD